ncbi:hypothetical protein O6H91_08G095900 [Diphasiastrum complanatum]|uniref:Uncharacterized protein n=1 Tax=Diphasiastrum complanatum TaxID=34168 RepID=A0ACC2D0A3_DIPCM|nr:hypothetical protein O6H91_08G095900 [Diphasiastrum complanatum]
MSSLATTSHPAAFPNSGFPTNGSPTLASVRLSRFRCCADSSPANSTSSAKRTNNNSQDRSKFVDTRIHWGSSTEGWIGGDESPSSLPSGSESNSSHDPIKEPQDQSGAALRDALVGLILKASGTHYQYLGVSPTADLDEIKTAYRRLSKEYHPDTTSLPLEVAAQKFVRLKEAYNVLSSVEERQFYDWKLAQEISKQQGGQFLWPYEVDKTQEGAGPGSSWNSKDYEYESRDPVDILGGRNMPLSEQAQSALLFDFLALFVSIASIIYAAFFKHK